jgi:hypothetical protein
MFFCVHDLKRCMLSEVPAYITQSVFGRKRENSLILSMKTNKGAHLIGIYKSTNTMTPHQHKVTLQSIICLFLSLECLILSPFLFSSCSYLGPKNAKYQRKIDGHHAKLLTEKMFWDWCSYSWLLSKKVKPIKWRFFFVYTYFLNI